MFSKLLDDVLKFTTEMNNSNKQSSKQKVFGMWIKDKDISDIINITYDPFVKFNVTSKNVNKYRLNKWSPPEEANELKRDFSVKQFYVLLHSLQNSELSGHAALQEICDWIQPLTTDQRDTLYKILNKDLKIRFGIKQMNKVKPKFLSDFSVSLGYAYNKKTEKDLKKISNGRCKWYISRKLDGVRCITILRYDKDLGKHLCEFYFRSGIRIETLGKLESDLFKYITPILPKESFVFDGEVCKIDAQGKEDFKGVMHEIRKKDHEMEDPKYMMFDYLTLDEFQLQVSSKERIFSTRLVGLKDVLEKGQKNCKNPRCFMIQQLEHNDENFLKMFKESKTEKWEGLMLRRDDPYKGKRCKDLLKVKRFHTEEYKVQEVLNGPFRIIDPETGLEKEIETLASVVISHKNNRVQVGSGFSLKERQLYHAKPYLIKGKVISVQYFETVKDKNGKESLRFPTFKGVHGKKR